MLGCSHLLCALVLFLVSQMLQTGCILLLLVQRQRGEAQRARSACVVLGITLQMEALFGGPELPQQLLALKLHSLQAEQQQVAEVVVVVVVVPVPLLQEHQHKEW